MPSIDERIVSMAFQNAQFEAGVAQTMRSLSKLDTALASIGSKNALSDIEKAANKVTLEQPMSALDKLKARFSRAGDGAAEGMNQIERAGNKVTLSGPIGALDKIQSKVARVGIGSAAGFNEIDRSANRVKLEGLHHALDSVTAKFSVLDGAASVALGNIASKAAAKGASMAKSVALGPITQGFQEYATNLNSIQTILANVEVSGAGLPEVNAALKELNEYSDQTIYNFSQMANNIGLFTAAGVDLEKSVSSIKGLANLAALSGSDNEKATHAMTQLSQAIAAGKVNMQDWISVRNAGMGGSVFQRALATTAENMGTLDKGAVSLKGKMKAVQINGEAFTDSIRMKPGEKSWLTSDVLTSTLAQFTGDLSDAELAAQGFTQEQITAIQKQAKTAKDAATQVKELNQVFKVVIESIGSGWSETFQNIFGDFTQAKKLFTGVTKSITDFVGKNADARNKVLKAWNKEGGRTALIEGLKNAFQALFAILKPIGQAFRDIFPRKSADDLIEMTKNFRDFTTGLKPGAATIDGIKRTARGLFAVLHIGWSIVKGVVGVIGELLGVVGKGSGGFLNFTGSIGDFLVAVDDALTKGGLLTSFFDGVAKVLKLPLQLLTGITSAIFGLFGGIDSSGAAKVSGGLDKVSGAAGPLTQVLNTLKGAWDGLVDIFRDAKDLVSPWLDKIGEQLSNLGSLIGNAFKGENFGKTMSGLQTAFIGGIFLALKKAISGAGGSFVGILKPVNAALGALTGNLKAMQQHVKAQVILMIATAIGILAASTVMLSKVDAAGLSKAMTAISVGLGQLVAGLALLGKIGKGGGFLTLPILAGSLILLAASMVILATAMKIFATMSWEELAKGLIGVGGGLAVIAAGMKFLGPGTIIQAPALLLLAVALNAIALAVKQFASLSWEELGRGLVGVLGSLVAIIAPVTAAGPELAVASVGVIGIAFALNMLAGAVKSFGEMDMGQMIQGLLGASLALVGIGVAMWAIPPHAILMAAGLVVVATALTGIAGAVKLFGSMSVGELAKGLIAMGGALLILAVGLTAMSGTLLGAAGLMVAATALAVLAPTLAFLGTLKWSTIFRGLGAIALALGVLAIAGLAAGPGLSALGVALLPLAGAFVLTAGAAYLFAKALQLLAGEGTKGIAVMVAAITAFVAILPKIIIEFIKGLVDIVAELAKILPQVADSLVKIINTIIDVVIRSTPRLALAIGTLVDGILQVIIRDSPKLIQGGITLVLNLLKGLDQYIPKVIPRVASIVVKFLSGLAAKAPSIVAAGAKLIVAFLQGIANNISKVVQTAYKVVFAFLDGVIRSAPKFVTAGARAIEGFLTAIGNAIPRLIRAGVRIVTKTLDGISSQFDDVARAATRFVVRFFQAFGSRENTRRMVDSGFKAAINVLRGIADGIKKDDNMKEVIDAAEDLGIAIVEGIGKGLIGLPGKLGAKLISPLKGGLKGAKGLLGIHSPSKVFVEIGQNITDGLGIGLTGVPGALDKGITGPIGQMLKATKGLKEFGKFLGGEFRDGLTGGLWDDGKTEAQRQIEGAFTSLKTKITEEHKKLREKITAEEEKLNELLQDPKKNAAKIDRLRATIAGDERTLALSQFRSRSLIAQLEDEKTALGQLAAAYESTSKDLEDAKAALDTLQQERKSAIQGYEDQFKALPDIDQLVDAAVTEAGLSGAEKWQAIREKQEAEEKRRRIDQVALYKQSLQDQIVATQKYMDTLGKLRAAGLDDTTYKKLLAMGTAGQEFASQLLAQGPRGIEELKKLDEQLAKSAFDLATKAGKDLYDAGIKAAEGLVKGLQDKQADIRKMMEFIADTMIKSLKFRLGIRSPSRIFAEMGRFSAQGLVDGLTESQGLVGDAAASLGEEAANALSKTLAGIQNGVDTDLTITPVLDLSQVQKDASQLQDLTNVTPITAAASYGQAASISSEQAAQAAEADSGGSTVLEFNFEQNNTSPKALDDVEIYRKTKNQLSQVKDALGLVP